MGDGLGCTAWIPEVTTSAGLHFPAGRCFRPVVDGELCDLCSATAQKVAAKAARPDRSAGSAAPAGPRASDLWGIAVARLPLTSKAKHVATLLALSYMNHHDLRHARPSLNRLHIETGLAESTCQAALNELRAAGVLKIQRRGNWKSRRATTYEGVPESDWPPRAYASSHR